MPEPLTGLQTWSETGPQLRHSIEAVERTLANAVAADGRARTALTAVSERLNRAADNEGLLLPPRTFQTMNGDLWPEFSALRDGIRPWTDRLAHLGPTALTHDDVERIPHAKTRRAFVDARGIAYFVAHPTAYHAPARTLDQDASAASRLAQLRMMYRFGGSLPPGFHHDATYRDGSAFLRTEFICTVDGAVEVTGPYANVYPDDYIRITNGEKNKKK